MYIAPNSIIRCLSGVPIDNTRMYVVDENMN